MLHLKTISHNQLLLADIVGVDIDIQLMNSTFVNVHRSRLEVESSVQEELRELCAVFARNAQAQPFYKHLGPHRDEIVRAAYGEVVQRLQ